jgi:hypothetical protein
MLGSGWLKFWLDSWLRGGCAQTREESTFMLDGMDVRKRKALGVFLRKLLFVRQESPKRDVFRWRMHDAEWKGPRSSKSVDASFYTAFAPHTKPC